MSDWSPAGTSLFFSISTSLLPAPKQFKYWVLKFSSEEKSILWLRGIFRIAATICWPWHACAVIWFTKSIDLTTGKHQQQKWLSIKKVRSYGETPPFSFRANYVCTVEEIFATTYISRFLTDDISRHFSFFFVYFFSWKTRRIGGVKMSYNKVEGVESNSNFFFLFLFHSNLCSTIHCLLRSNFSIHTITTLITTHYSPFRDSHTYTSSHNFPSLHTNLLFPTSTALPIPVINNEYPHNPLPPPKEKQQQQQHLQHRDSNTRLKK